MNNKDTYGIKVSMDLTDFDKGMKKITDATKKVEEKTQVKINNPFADANKYDFKGKFKGLGIDELNKKLKETKELTDKMRKDLFKFDYYDITTERLSQLIPTGSIEQMDEYKQKMAELMELEDELGKKNALPELSEEQRNEIAFMALDTEALQHRLTQAEIELTKFNNKGVLSEEDALRVQEINDLIAKISARMVELGATPLRFKQSMGEVKEETEEVAKNITTISTKTRVSLGNLSAPFNKATKSLRRFALSLFGIRSIWSMLSRAMRTYMSNNDKMQNTMKGVWNALGTLMAPVAEFLANLFLKLLGYVNVLTKALWNYDFIAKANAATMENYAKKTKKATQALAGFDEINNLAQQNQLDEDTGPEGLIPEIKLNEGIVKKLQELAEWIKKNKNLIKKLAEGFALVFGATAVAKWLGGMGAILGSGTGVLTGLLGIGAALIWIYDTLKLIELYKEWKEYKEWLDDYYQALDKQTEKTKEINEQKVEEAKTWEKGSDKVAKYAGNLRSGILGTKAFIKNNKVSIKQLGEFAEQMDSDIKAYKELYEQGKLNDKQAATYADTMAQLGLKVDGTEMSFKEYITYQGILNSETEDAAKKAKEYAAQINGISTEANNTKNSVGDLQNKIKDFSSTDYKVTIDMASTVQEGARSLDDFVKKVANSVDEIGKQKATINIESNFKVNGGEMKTLLQGLANSGLAAAFNLENQVKSFLRDVPFLSIGTDDVKREGLAYLHAGEKVVPANVASGGYTNSDDTNSLLRELIETVQEKKFTASISSDDVGKASVNYIRNQNRIMGGSVI